MEHKLSMKVNFSLWVHMQDTVIKKQLKIASLVTYFILEMENWVNLEFDIFITADLNYSNVFYLEYPCSTHNQGEESRKVWSQYFHEHGNVIENISNKSGKKLKERT